MPNLGVWELDVILVLVLAILVVGRLSEVGGAAGKGLRGFRRATIDRRSARPRAAPAAPPPPVPSALVTSAPPPDATPTVVVENKCPSCNTVNPTGQVFCGQCGTRLSGAA